MHWQHEQLLVYRVIELTLETIYMPKGLFCGPLPQVWGNWLDIVLLIVDINKFRRRHQVSALRASSTPRTCSGRCNRCSGQQAVELCTCTSTYVDKALRKHAASTEPAWQDFGQKAGVVIWPSVDSHVKNWP